MNAEKRIDYEISRERSPEDIEREIELERRKHEYQKQKLEYVYKTAPVTLYDAHVKGYEVRPEVWPKILVQVSGLVRLATWRPYLGVYCYGQRESEHIGIPAIRFWYPVPEAIES